MLRGENTQLRQCEENRKADMQSLEAVYKRQKDADALHYQNLVARTDRTAAQHTQTISRLQRDVYVWRRKFDEGCVRTPEAETLDIRLDEMTKANKALMDADAKKNEKISRLEAQLEAAALLANQITPSPADVKSTIADRDHHPEHEYAQLQAACQENEQLRQETQALRQQIQDLCQVKSAMYEEGSRLVQENHNLTEQCQDLSVKLNTLAQQGVEDGEVKATTQIEHDALKREVARLEAIRVQYEGETTEEKEKLEVEKTALRHQAEEWVNDREKVLSQQFAIELDQARAQIHAELEAKFVQRQEALQGEKEQLEQALQREKQACQLESAAKTTYFKGQQLAEKNAEANCKELRWFKDAHPKLTELYKSVRSEVQKLRKENAKLQGKPANDAKSEGRQRQAAQDAGISPSRRTRKDVLPEGSQGSRSDRVDAASPLQHAARAPRPDGNKR